MGVVAAGADGKMRPGDSVLIWSAERLSYRDTLARVMKN